MWIARISRKSGDKIIKDEFHTDELSRLMEMLSVLGYDEAEVLEIHIYKGGENGE